MSHSPNKRLLSDILADDTDADFRAALLDDTLLFVRRKRRFRKVRNGAYASLALVGLALASFHFLASKPSFSRRVEPGYVLITTQPLPADAVVSTSQDRSVATISSSPTINFVTTTDNTAPVLRQLDDEELLALLPSPALIVRRGPHLAEVVFAEPDLQHTVSPN